MAVMESQALKSRGAVLEMRAMAVLGGARNVVNMSSLECIGSKGSNRKGRDVTVVDSKGMAV